MIRTRFGRAGAVNCVDIQVPEEMGKENDMKGNAKGILIYYNHRRRCNDGPNNDHFKLCDFSKKS